MIIKEFTPDGKFEKNSVIIADFRTVDYEDESTVIQSVVADKYGIDLYPVMCEINQLVIHYLVKNYGDCDWFIDKTLIESFR